MYTVMYRPRLGPDPRLALRERLRLTAEAQSFNALNRANFNLPSAIADNPVTFGRISSARDPRQIQFALRLAF